MPGRPEGDELSLVVGVRGKGVVDNLNHVNQDERNIFFEVLDKNNIHYTHFYNLEDS